MIKIGNNWWKHFFNHLYLVTDARSVCDASLTRKEATLIEEVLNLNKNDRILDLLGGHGRHSLELAKRGYKDVTVLDFSPYLIGLGRKMVQETGLQVKFIRRDARNNRLKNNSFTVILVMANSFGYFPDDSENVKILKEIYRLLKKRGKLLLDLTDAEYARKNLETVSWHEASTDIVVCRQRELHDNFIKAREVVISKKDGILRDGVYGAHIYDKETISRLLRNIGFNDIQIVDNLSLHTKRKDYGFLTSRMFVTAVKS